jgi:tetratricopeptide (TPR) repeat protein
MRTIALVILIIAIVATLLFVHHQPSGSITVFGNGRQLVTRTTPIYIAARGRDVCVTRPEFDQTLTATSTTHDEIPARVRFGYTVPQMIPAGWGDSDWCGSLRRRIERTVSQASSGIPASEYLDQRRAAGDRIARALEDDLRTSGVQAGSVSVRIDLPPGFDRLRPVPEVASRAKRARPVIFIGLDGADWELLRGYMSAGVMPNLKRLVDNGMSGDLQTEEPPLSPIVWTTMMTGVSPLEHQILDFTRFNPSTHDKEPITSDERRAPAIWNMLDYAGKEAAVFGLWATYAAEPVHGINVSDRLFTFLYSESERPPGVVYPPGRQRWADLQESAAEREIGEDRLREYLPGLTHIEYTDLAKIENPYSDPRAALRRILINTEVYHRLSLDYLRSRAQLPDLTIVYFEGTDTIGHVFAPFAPLKQPSISQADYDRYSGVPEKYFRYIDTIIGDYLKFDAAIVIASDHGFHWHEGRPAISSTATATAAKWHRKYGIYVVSGAPATSPAPEGIRDICRLLRQLTGTPDADYSRYFQRAASPPAISKRAAGEDLAKLRALGYIGSNESTRSAAPTADTKTAGAYNNEGLILRNAHRVDEAIAAFERAMAIDPHYASPMWNLSETLFEAHRDLDRADSLLIAAMQNGLNDAARDVIVRSIAYQRSGRADRSLELLEQAVAAKPGDPELHIFRGRYRLDRHDCSGALDDFRAAEASNNPLAFASAGLAQMCLGDSAGAQESFARAHELDPTLQLPR